MLVLVPLGLLAASVAADVAFLATGNSSWAEIAFGLIGGGVAAAILAAPFRFIAWMAMPYSDQEERMGRRQGTLNLVGFTLFILGWLVRRPDGHVPPTSALVFSVVGLGLTGVTAWLGGRPANRGELPVPGLVGR
jgi:uncharacterized membrane protein